MSLEWITILLFGTMFLLLATGLPIAWVLGGAGIFLAYFLIGPESIVMGLFGVNAVTGYGVLVCVPMFVFMGLILSESGIIDNLFITLRNWLGFLPGSLASSTIGVCAAIAAMVGEITPATLTMGVTALPAMLRQGYDKKIAVGTVMSGAALGFLIPPSVIAVLYAVIAKQSIGRLFAGGLIPGVILSISFIIYITIRCYFQPSIGPAVPREERPSWSVKIASLRGITLPFVVIIAVLGSVFTGIATPVEASAVGALASVIVSVIHRSFSWKVLKYALTYTMRLTGVAMWIFIAALSFGKIYNALGAANFIESAVGVAGLSPIAILLIMQFSYFILGMILDDTAILFICLPIYIPIANSLGFDPVWFGVLYIVNMQMAFLTPPFGYCLFLIKSVVPEDITMGDIYNSVWPFVAIQATTLGLCIAFPSLVLWFPSIVFLK